LFPETSLEIAYWRAAYRHSEGNKWIMISDREVARVFKERGSSNTYIMKHCTADNVRNRDAELKINTKSVQESSNTETSGQTSEKISERLLERAQWA
jgi:hypothetical protein